MSSPGYPLVASTSLSLLHVHLFPQEEPPSVISELKYVMRMRRGWWVDKSSGQDKDLVVVVDT